MNTTTILYCVITFAVTLIAAGAAAFFIGVAYRKKVAEAEIGSAEDQAKRIINEAYKSAEAKKKELLIEAKEEAHKLRSEADRDIKERRSEVSRQERRIQHLRVGQNGICTFSNPAALRLHRIPVINSR